MTRGPGGSDPTAAAGRARLIAADASIRSVWFRNSARGAVALAAAVAVAKLTDVQHAFWVVLGTLSVLRTSAAATGSTALRALARNRRRLRDRRGAAGGASAPARPRCGPRCRVAVLVAAYTPGTAPFAVGQAAFTVTVVVLFNLLVPAGWTGRAGADRGRRDRLRGQRRGRRPVLAAGRRLVLVGDNLADAFRGGAALPRRGGRLGARRQPTRGRPGGRAAIAAGIRLDDAVRGYLTEQGSKRIAEERPVGPGHGRERLRLTAHSIASLPGLAAARGPAADHPVSAAVRNELTGDSARLAAFYADIATEVSKPAAARGGQGPVTAPAVEPQRASAQPCAAGRPHYHPEVLWVRDHLRHLGSHSAEIIGPAGRLAALRRRPWWR